ncbi:MAG: DUF2192 domain-containing protein [Ignisphaera sp.]
MNLRRKRIEAITTTWSIIVSKPVKKREEAIDILKSVYSNMGVEPIRGSSSPPDLYDKEMASLYIIGKWGLGIDKELDEETLKSLFSTEITFETMMKALASSTSKEDFCKAIGDLCSRLSDSFIARFLRFVFTLYYFGFAKFEDLAMIMRKLYNFFEPLQETVRRFAKFVIAYEVGSRIASGQVKNQLDINMAKNVVALEIGIPKAVPSTGYIIEVSKHFFTLPENIVKNISVSNNKKEQRSDDNV